MNVLVTGGAGYIGSHAVLRLLADGHRVTVLDNLERGHRPAVLAAGLDETDLLAVDLRDTARLTAELERRGIEAVIHFAALAYVGESVTDPLKYYDNNTAGSLSLLEAMDDAGVRKLVFSSTCATYGEPDKMPITEDTPQHPINPYGASKLFVERMLRDYAAANDDFAFAALRYFNVCGSDPQGRIGEDHDPETHLIPVLLDVARGKRDKMTIFGEDFSTPDGTCIRDYIHVEDLIDAHVLAMHKLAPGDQWFYNLGTGEGRTVRQVLEAARRVTGRDIPAEVGPRRPGDPPSLYADASKIQRELGWKAQHTNLDDAIAHAWKWFQTHPDGYGD